MFGVKCQVVSVYIGAVTVQSNRDCNRNILIVITNNLVRLLYIFNGLLRYSGYGIVT